MKRIPLLCTLSLAVAFMIAAVSVGCRGPAEKPLPKSGPQYRYQEPEITLYDNDTGQKKKIKFEEYIAGVVAAEMEPTWPIEALAAQSTLARTFTLHKIKYEKGYPNTEQMHPPAQRNFRLMIPPASHPRYGRR